MASEQELQKISPPAINDTQPQFTAEAYNKVVAGTNLVDIRLLNSDFEIQPEYFMVRHQERLEGGDLIKLQFDPLDVLVQMKLPVEGRGLASARWKFRAGAYHRRKKLVVVNAEYLIVYDCVGGLDEYHVEFFLKKVGKIAIYPYFRHLVSAYSSAAHADLPVLPMLKEKPNHFAKAKPTVSD